MNNLLFLIISIFLTLGILMCRKKVVQYLVRDYVSGLRKQKFLESEIFTKERKMLKSLNLIFLSGGILFLTLFLVLLVGEFIGFFITQDRVVSVLEKDSFLKKVWDFSGLFLLFGIILYVFWYYNIFRWPWRK